MAPGILNKLLELIEGWSRQVWALCLQSILTNSAQGKKRVRPLQMIQLIRNYYINVWQTGMITEFHNFIICQHWDHTLHIIILLSQLNWPHCLLLSFNWHFPHPWLMRKRHTQIHNSYLFLKKFSWISGCFPHSSFRFLCYHVPGKDMVKNLRILKCKIALHKNLNKHKIIPVIFSV